MANLKQAIIAIKTGDNATGRQLLREILQAEPGNENAWLWLSSAVETEVERRYCLNNVLKINPNNELAQRGLATLVHSPTKPSPSATSGDTPSSVSTQVKKLRRLPTRTKTDSPDVPAQETKTGGSLSPGNSPTEPLPLTPSVRMRAEAALQQVTAARMRGLTPNLNDANLAQASLNGADLSESSLREINLSQADLRQANLRHTNLSHANLQVASLGEANLSEARLTEANLSGADLRQANLGGAHLEQANLRGAYMGWADLNQADLNEADLTGTNLDGASLNGANLIGIKYDDKTIWPAGFTPPNTAPTIELEMPGPSLPETANLPPQVAANVTTMEVVLPFQPPTEILPEDQLDSTLKKFLTESQNPATVQHLYNRVSEILTSQEIILYIAIQNKPVLNVSPDCIVLTNRRFIIYSPKLLGGVDFTDYTWRHLYDAQLDEGMVGATIRMKTIDKQIFAIGYLPKKQARRIYVIAQEMEEQVIEERRLREMEEKQAAAGGVYMQRVSAPNQGPVSCAGKDTQSLPVPGIESSEQALTKSKADQIIVQHAGTQPSSPRSPGWKKFLNEEQDQTVVQQVFSKVSEILTREEQVYYIAVQNKPLVNITPICVILTNRRFIIYNSKLLGGANFTDHIWRELHSAHIKEGIMGATFIIKTVKNQKIIIEYMPKRQARRLYAFAQEMEEQVAEERRQRNMEEKRAEAGGVYVQETMTAPPQSSPAPAAQKDPLQQLKQLKEMLDIGLISKVEFETKKGEILSRI